MRALSTFAPEQAAKIRFLLTDIDDTLTTDGHLTAGAYAALERLSAAGITVIPITSRGLRSVEPIARSSMHYLSKFCLWFRVAHWQVTKTIAKRT